ncbi:oomycete secretome protein [Acrasis kona]|uniref:Oomycete secretome protein n=1 Tax=Acrasis kona TaxID=1008807 RepID=A0AAW2YRI2_9EUKA
MNIHLASLVVLLAATFIHCHSWIDCVKYTDPSSGFNDPTKCLARPRNYVKHEGAGFGADTGYNDQGGTCKYPLTASTPMSSFYTTKFPMASYTVGERVCLTWPAKNHVAAQCTNAFIPDTENKVFISAVNPSVDNVGAWTLLKDFGNSPKGQMSTGKGFQNCPNFCDNPDKAFCYQCFDMPNMAAGIYSFQWRWVFNENTPAYTSCWDAVVTTSGGSKPTTLAPSTTTAGPSTTLAPLNGDAVRILNPPTYADIMNTKTIVVKVDYSASQNVDIIVDLLSEKTYAWFGKAIVKNVPKGSKTIDMTINVMQIPEPGNYVVKPWIVQAGRGEEPNAWAMELDKREYPLRMGVGAAPPASTLNSSSAARSASFWVFVVCIVIYFVL